MYTSGKFCVIGHTTRKALQIYEDMKLLLPEWINPENGYKYYGAKQVEKMIRINEYKGLGFSLKDINSMEKADGNLDEFLKRRLNEINNEIQDREEIKSKLQEKLKKDTLKSSAYACEICIVNEIFALYNEATIKIENVGEIVGKLYEKCSNGYEKAGPHFILYDNYDNEHEEAKMKVGLPVISRGNNKDELLHIVGGHYLKTIHRSGFSKVGLAHMALLDYAEKNNIKLSKMAVERYVSFKEVEVYYKVEE